MDFNYFEYVIAYKAMNDSVYAASIADHFNPAHYDNKGIKTLLSKIFDFYGRRHVLPTPTEIGVMSSESEKESMRDVFREFKKIDDNLDPTELILNTEKFIREKAIRCSIENVVKDFDENKGHDPEGVSEEFSKACGISLISDIGLNYFKDIDKFCDHLLTPNSTISTGFRWLDKMLGGGWQAMGRALYVFSGAANVGKSIFLGHFVVSGLKQGKNVLLITLEMPEMMYASRTTANISQIQMNDLKFKVNEFKRSVESFQSTFGSHLVIKEFPTKMLTVNQLTAYTQKLIRSGFKPDMVVVDYLNLLSKGSSSNGTYEEVKAITEHLRAFTYTFKIPVITATQLNRSGYGKDDPGMENTSDSIGVAMTADVMCSIWAKKEERDMNIVHLGMQRNRLGPNFGSTIIHVDYPTMSLTEPEDDGADISDMFPDGDTVESKTNSVNDLMSKFELA